MITWPPTEVTPITMVTIANATNDVKSAATPIMIADTMKIVVTRSRRSMRSPSGSTKTSPAA
jgi:hypothetical protein